MRFSVMRLSNRPISLVSAVSSSMGLDIGSAKDSNGLAAHVKDKPATGAITADSIDLRPISWFDLSLAWNLSENIVSSRFECFSP